MLLTCEHCSTQYRVADAKVPPEGLLVRCSKCQHRFVVRLEHPADPTPAEQTPTTRAGRYSLGGGRKARRKTQKRARAEPRARRVQPPTAPPAPQQNFEPESAVAQSPEPPAAASEAWTDSAGPAPMHALPGLLERAREVLAGLGGELASRIPALLARLVELRAHLPEPRRLAAGAALSTALLALLLGIRMIGSGGKEPSTRAATAPAAQSTVQPAPSAAETAAALAAPSTPGAEDPLLMEAPAEADVEPIAVPAFTALPAAPAPRPAATSRPASTPKPRARRTAAPKPAKPAPRVAVTTRAAQPSQSSSSGSKSRRREPTETPVQKEVSGWSVEH